jgi:NAD(P)-dependent dehydrogenase (short-subunit alcohol dehydrogenase family)
VTQSRRAGTVPLQWHWGGERDNVQVDLKGKVALVTGSSRGIGRAIAEGFVRAGARVWFHGTDDSSKPIADNLSQPFVAADFTSPDDVQRMAETIASNEARLDILVNNAGIEPIMPVESIDMGKFDACFAVNVRSPLQLTTALLPLLKRSGALAGASIINITSIHDSVPYPHNSVYSMSKAALAMFTKTASIELAPLKIRVNNLAPGAIETDINREVIDQIGRDKFARWIPAGRVGTVDEVVGPALFLASDGASYVTGATLYADGAYRHHLVRYRPDPGAH